MRHVKLNLLSWSRELCQAPTLIRNRIKNSAIVRAIFAFWNQNYQMVRVSKSLSELEDSKGILQRTKPRIS